MIAVHEIFRLTPLKRTSPWRVEGWASPLGLKERYLKDLMRREPLQLVLWTPSQLHLMQPGCQEAADRQYERSLRLRSEFKPQRDPSWVSFAYVDFWEGRERD